MAQRWGLWGGLALFVALLLLPAPAGMPLTAWRVVALAALMAAWWMTQALPLTATVAPSTLPMVAGMISSLTSSSAAVDCASLPLPSVGIDTRATEPSLLYSTSLPGSMLRLPSA